MSFKEALKEVYDEGKYTLVRFDWKSEFESDDPRPGSVKHRVCHPSSKMLFTYHLSLSLVLSSVSNYFICSLSSITPMWVPLMQR